MVDIYGYRWTSAYGDNPAASAGKMWAKGLRGVTADQVAIGIEAALVCADPWPPTLPAFRALCLGVPSFATVKAEIRKPGEECSAFAVLVYRKLDQWQFARAEQDKAERMLHDAYEAAREHVMRGGELPKPELRIVHEVVPKREWQPASPEVAERHMAKLAEILGENTPSLEDAEAEAE